MRTKIAFFAFILSLMTFVSNAQVDSAYSLQQCIDYALQNQANVKNAQLDENIAKARVSEIKSVGTPQINGTISLVDNPALKRFFYQVGPNAFIPPPPGAQPGDVIASPNFFQLRSAGDASATISQLIFDGSYFVGLQAAKAYKELSEKNTKQTKIQTVDAVTKAYYLVVINKERATLLDNNIGRLDTMLKQARAMYAQGFIEKIDVDRIEVSYNNLVIEKQKFGNLLQLSELLLKHQMGMSLESNMKLSGTIQEIQLDSSMVNTGKIDYQSRVEYQVMQSQYRLQQLDLKNIKASRLPRISAFATGGYVRQDTKFTNLFTGTWYDYSMWGLSMNVPILGIQSQYKARQSKYTLSKVENAMVSLENSIDLQIAQSKTNYNNNVTSLKAHQRNMELAQEVVRVSKVKYDAGLGSNLEVVNAESAFKEAQTNYYNAMYEALISKIDYQIATGTLYNE